MSNHEITVLGPRKKHVVCQAITILADWSRHTLDRFWSPLALTISRQDLAVMVCRWINSDPHESRHGDLHTDEVFVFGISVDHLVDQHTVRARDVTPAFQEELRRVAELCLVDPESSATLIRE